MSRLISLVVTVLLSVLVLPTNAQMFPKLIKCDITADATVQYDYGPTFNDQMLAWGKACGIFPTTLPKPVKRCEKNGLTSESQIIFADGGKLLVSPDVIISECDGKWTDTWTRDAYHADERLQNVSDKILKKKSRHNEPIPVVNGRRRSIAVPRADPGYVFMRPDDSSEIPLRDNPNAKANVFIGIAISGGGTRAANFGLAVIEQLEELGIMPHVSAISSVSGGSVAAAYYGLFGAQDRNGANRGDPIATTNRDDRAVFWAKAKVDLLQNLRTEWTRKYLSPQNLIATAFTSKNRTDLLADVFDKSLFHGKTFDDLGNFGPARPILSINATTANELRFDAGSPIAARGPNAPSLLFQSFSFNKASFDALGSDLSAVKISSAVAASAAFPGVFNDLTLASFAGNSRSSEPIDGDLHLFDGGPSDNLGVDALSDIAARWFATYYGSEAPSNGCLLIVIDAFPSQTGRVTLGDERDPRRFYDQLIDFNFMDATDALLQRRREDSLAQLGVPLVTQGEFSWFYTTRTPGLPSMLVRKGHLFNESTDVQLGAYAREESSDLAYHNGYVPHMVCAVWHISLDDIRSVSMGSAINDGKIISYESPIPDMSPVAEYGIPPAEKQRRIDQVNEQLRNIEKAKSDFAELPEIQFRDSVWQIVSRTKTDFDLSGPPGCTKTVVQNALWDAARIAVYDDFETRQKVCAWMESHNVAPSKTCADLQSENHAGRYPVALIKAGQTYGIVGCLAPSSSASSKR